MFDTILYNASVFHHGNFLDDHGVAIQDGKILRMGRSEAIQALEAENSVDLEGGLLAPGYIDLHIHGLLKYLIDNGRRDLEAISQALPQFGTTAFLPTILPHSPDEEGDFLRNIALADTPGAEYLGFFLEGPFIAKTGAIRPEALTDKSPERIQRITTALAPYRVVFAISPEVPGIESILDHMNTPAFITHTQADAAQTVAAIARGAVHATHFYNVFFIPEESDPGVRPSGAVEAILQNPDVSVDFILDGEHVDPIAVKLALSCKPVDKVCLITDSNIGAGMKPGIYSGFGGDEVQFSYPGGPARGTANSLHPGGLYGSGLTMDLAVRNVVKFGIGSAETALTMASTSPAKVLGVYGRKGDIDTGFDADLLYLDTNLHILRTWVAGKCVYTR